MALPANHQPGHSSGGFGNMCCAVIRKGEIVGFLEMVTQHTFQPLVSCNTGGAKGRAPLRLKTCQNIRVEKRRGVREFSLCFLKRLSPLHHGV